MALYFIGDVQGCDGPLQHLLQRIDFSPSRDHLVVLGDVVNRGPASLQVVRRLMALDGAAQCLLGNHDLHLLAVAHGMRKPHRHDTLDALLHSPDRHAVLDWLRQRPLALHSRGWLLVHAGVLPAWSAAQTVALANEVSLRLRSPEGLPWLGRMYGNQPDCWSDDWVGDDRARVVVNALTRLRFCSAQGVMDFDSKDSAGAAPPGFMPWFDVPGRQSAATPIAFGHWSTLGLLQRPHLLGLDSGCVWGGQLSAARLEAARPGQPWEVHEIIQCNCPQAQVHGGKQRG